MKPTEYNGTTTSCTQPRKNMTTMGRVYISDLIMIRWIIDVPYIYNWEQYSPYNAWTLYVGIRTYAQIVDSLSRGHDVTQNIDKKLNLLLFLHPHVPNTDEKVNACYLCAYTFIDILRTVHISTRQTSKNYNINTGTEIKKIFYTSALMNPFCQHRSGIYNGSGTGITMLEGSP